MCKVPSNFASNVKVTSKGFHVVKTGVQGLWWVDEEIRRITHFEPVYFRKKLINSHIVLIFLKIKSDFLGLYLFHSK